MDISTLDDAKSCDKHRKQYYVEQCSTCSSFGRVSDVTTEFNYMEYDYNLCAKYWTNLGVQNGIKETHL
jgi:hypothetical protein